MLNETTAARIRSEISDFHTQDVSAYTPSGLVSIAEYVFSRINWLTFWLPSLVGLWTFDFRCWRPLRGGFALLYQLPARQL